MDQDLRKEIEIAMNLRDFCLECKEQEKCKEDMKKCKAVQFTEFIINKIIAEKMNNML
ncbi:hypothetical protein SAMN05661008_01576 [Alkalithermobacter thermoalcaliphilus JW-YL-7 = DSM 7308]|uniref:Uncharacterized protein n=1 Tax=Alkalithermobacter thermoalcaliphilus JW-YL-7 = DSM 7308 TaxID=1121328 RepID=A0A150FS94_CLOPD|nr:hypothetical protein JWYL7_1551 [[Clostridium] paradoxum JW-YL-7 = DSM 7308]SHL16247.1 hypothetical protein SAMN05661008_01576 [[Clostridium] paradoxum JW-YL-7 = DSM 7308]